MRTIIVLLILAGVSLNAIVGENGIITNAMEASIMSRFSNYDEELKINAVEDNGVYASGDKIKSYIPSMEDKDLENFIIISSKLLYIGKNELESQIAEKLKLGGSTDVSDIGAVVEEVQQIVDNVVKVREENKDKVPVGDSDKLEDLEKLKVEGKEQYTDDSEGLIGVRLFARNGLNMNNGNWNILIEYNSSNKETARYESGYYWLKKGTTYTIKGEKIEFKNDYVVNYSRGEYYVLSGRAVNWNVNATLGVPDKIVDGKHTLALNLDPMNLANGEWVESEETDEVNKEKFYNFKVKDGETLKDTGIQKVGDVEYDESDKSLKINKDKEKNPDGVGGYLKIDSDYNGQNLDFTNGFSFEFYGNFDEICRTCGYPEVTSGQNRNMGGAFALFAKTTSLKRTDYSKALRCGSNADWNRMSFAVFDSSSLNIKGDFFETYNGRLYRIPTEIGFDKSSDTYITYVWQVYDHDESIKYKQNNLELYESCKGNFDEVMDKYYNEKNIKLDKILYYINSEMLGYGYFAHDDLVKGTGYWGGNDSDFYIGACPFWSSDWVYYLKGRCFATRLYTQSLTPDQVKLNYDMTLKYRDSFKNE